jgi:4a-hydroxytetrahydrobiopterin dehydratase
MPDRLDENLVQDSLHALPSWTGDSTSIHRAVDATEEQATALTASVGETAQSMGHAADVERTETGLRIVLTTAAAGGVTAVDIAMASVIEDLVAEATGEAAVRVYRDPDDPTVEPYVDEDELALPQYTHDKFMGTPSGRVQGQGVFLPGGGSGSNDWEQGGA